MIFYIIFGTNLLTGGPVPVSVFLPILEFTEKEYQTESKRNETFAMIFLGSKAIQKTWSQSLELHEEATRQEGAPPTPVTASFVPWRRVQVSWITFGEKITFLKVPFRLDSV